MVTDRFNDVSPDSIAVVRDRIRSFPEELKPMVMEAFGAKGWPGLAPTHPRHAELTAGHLNEMWSTLDVIESNNGPKGDPIDAEKLRETLAGLAPDLLEGVKKLIVEDGFEVVNVAGPKTTPAYIECVAKHVASAVVLTNERLSRVHGLLSSIGATTDWERHAIISEATGGRTESSKQLTDDEIGDVRRVVSGLELGTLTFAVAADGATSIVPAANGDPVGSTGSATTEALPAHKVDDAEVTDMTPSGPTIEVSHLDRIDWAKLAAEMRVTKRTMLARAKEHAAAAGEPEPKSLDKLTVVARRRLVEALGVSLIGDTFPGSIDTADGRPIEPAKSSDVVEAGEGTPDVPADEKTAPPAARVNPPAPAAAVQSGNDPVNTRRSHALAKAAEHLEVIGKDPGLGIDGRLALVNAWHRHAELIGA